ncbi:MAG: ADP-ribosylglycohydrolase family protein [Deltaproteobacteria bacterium]|jgi:hypothetical protein|nr:ADP-ribosylglycohydrolase family protein [Deltaproteobacteria bacterium]
MILDDLAFEEKKDRAAGTLLGLLVGDALGRFAKYLIDMEGQSPSSEGFLQRLSEVTDLQSVPTSMEALHIVEIAEEFQRHLAAVQLAVEEGHFGLESAHDNREAIAMAKYFVAKVDHPYREAPFPKVLKEPSIQSWNKLTRILATVIPVSVFAAGDNFSNIFYFEKLLNWVNKDMQYHTKSITICQAALLLAELIAINCRKVSDIQQTHKRRYFAEQLVWSCPGLDPYMFHALNFEDYVDDPVFQRVRLDERIVSLANAFRQYYMVKNFESGLLETVAVGGDIQGNAAICGAVLGATFGKSGIPSKWLPGDGPDTEIHGGHGLPAKERGESAPKAEGGRKPRKRASAKASHDANRVKPRNQPKLYREAERIALSLLISPVPKKEFIDDLKKRIDMVTGESRGKPKGEARGHGKSQAEDVEGIRALLQEKFIDLHYEENKWKYPIVFGDKKYSAYSLYEMATFATYISGKKDNDPNIINSMAHDGYLNILVDRLNELYRHSRSV